VTLPNTKKICIAIPTINEKSNLEILIPELRILIPDSQILVVDDGSTDGTLEYLKLLRNLDSKVEAVFRGERLGIGSAHLYAIEHAAKYDFDFLVTMDGDLTHSPIDVYKMLTIISTTDLVVGSRYFDTGEVRGWNLFRTALTRGGHLATKLMFKSNLDMSSGLRAYRVQNIPIASIRKNVTLNYDFFFLSALVYIKEGLAIQQLGVSLNPRAFGTSKMHPRLMLKGMFTLLKYGLRIKKIRL